MFALKYRPLGLALAALSRICTRHCISARVTQFSSARLATASHASVGPLCMATRAAAHALLLLKYTYVRWLTDRQVGRCRNGRRWADGVGTRIDRNVAELCACRLNVVMMAHCPLAHTPVCNASCLSIAHGSAMALHLATHALAGCHEDPAGPRTSARPQCPVDPARGPSRSAVLRKIGGPRTTGGVARTSGRRGQRTNAFVLTLIM